MQQKMTRGFWPSTKAETASAASAARPQPLPTQSLNGSSATSVLSTIHQPAPVLPSQNTTQTAQQASGSRTVSMPGGDPALLVLLPLNGTFERKQITVPLFPDVLKIGRQTNAKTVPTPLNGYFDSKVLSRAHAEIWADRNGKIWIRDVKSSNGTFVNGARLSPENRDSEAHELRESDTLELGIDIVSEDQKSIVHHKVSAKVEHAGVQSSTSSVLDLNFGDIDPGSGGGLMGPPFPLIQMRGRGLSQGSLIGSSRASGPQGVNGLGGQRQMNAWLSPIPIEQIVKRLGVSTEIGSDMISANPFAGRTQICQASSPGLTAYE
jgi:pSer/pThr/pTyr-binding forkhead associated (FHA) protein